MDSIDLDVLKDLVSLMRETGAVYVKCGEVEVTLGPEPFKGTPEEPKAEFVHDGEEAERAQSRRNPLLDHPALRKRR